MLYTVTLGFEPAERLGHPKGVGIAVQRSYVVEADTEAQAFDRASQELLAALVIEAMATKPWAISYERTGDRRVAARLEYLRGELRAERISYGELAELQGLADQIEPGDVELLEAAGVPEFPDEATELPTHEGFSGDRS